MNKKGLVSILTPCYNGGKFVHRLLDSVLSQDYPHIEMIVVDDGSTDNTHSVVEGYAKSFESKGYVLKYLYQDNAGQAAALNKGLPFVEGEYLIWPDSDDMFYGNRAISIMVDALRSLDDSYAVVRCWEDFVDECTMNILSKNQYDSSKDYLFEEYLKGEITHAVSGTHMVRMKCFDEVIPSRHIFDKRQPQNFQMFIPLVYNYKIHTICQTLFWRFVRQNSHSHSKATYEMQIDTFCGYKEIMDNTLLSMNTLKGEQLQKSLRLSALLSLKGKVACALHNRKAKDARFYAKEMSRLGQKQTFAGKIRLILVSVPPLLTLFDFVVNRLRGYIKK